jgi:hypothetical protein
LQRTATRVTSMATFVDKEYPIRSASFNQCRVHANIGARRLFGRPLREFDLKKRNPSVAVLFCAGRIPAMPGNANCAQSSGGRGRFAKRRTTGPCRNGRNCLNAATVLECAARTRDDARRGRNCTLRRMRGATCLRSLDEREAEAKPITVPGRNRLTSLPPLARHGREERGRRSLKIQIVRLISSSTRISDSIRTSHHVRFALHVYSGSLPRAG